MDFTRSIYRQLLTTLQKQGYSFFTYHDYCLGKASGRFVILRHDIDKHPLNALIIARIEFTLGIRASYYFQIKQEIFNPEVIKQIADLGHEIGYHYNDLVSAKGNSQKAIESFQTNLALFRSIVPITTVAMHGSPTSKYDNRDLWQNYNYKEYGLIGEPYFDIDFSIMHYLTDTGRMWDGERYSVRDRVDNYQLKVNNKRSTRNTKRKTQNTKQYHSTSDLIRSIEHGTFPNQTMMTTHPQRWTDNKGEWLQELILQRLKNVLKWFLVSKSNNFGD
ncbi:MAG: hypothetical protein WCG93_05265 [Paludibacter sp.]